MRFATRITVLVTCLGSLAVPSLAGANATRVSRVTESEAKLAALAQPDVKAQRAANPGNHVDVELIVNRWRVQVWTASGSLVAEVFVAADSGRVVEKYTGYKAAWGMARGTPGAFGRDATAIWVWLPLLVLFLLPFIPRGAPGLRHADLVAIAALSVSIACFNRGWIDLSTPLLYPPMLWLLARMLWLGFRGPGSRPPDRILIPRRAMLLGIVFLVGFRVAFVIADGNVIDVGDASVVGAHLLTEGKPTYGHFPDRIERGDTYGPVTYEVYAPFSALFGGTTENRNAAPAKAAAIFLDLLALAALVLAAWRVRGPPLALFAGWFWVTCPFTLYVAMCAANDALPAALLALTLAAATVGRPAAGLLRGAASALGALSKMVSVVLLPVFARVKGSSGPPAAVAYSVGVLAAAALALLPFGFDVASIWHRTLGYQSGRGAPFSAWGLYSIPDPVRQAWLGFAVVVAVVAGVFPRRGEERTPERLAALAAGVLIAAELAAVYWFYTYIVWFLPAVAIAVLGGWREREISDPGPAATAA